MKVLIRTTTNGTEYWDTKEKRSIFVPNGVEPNFTPVVNPKSMLKEEKEQTDTKTDDPVNLESMTIKQLKEYAAANDIEIPDEVTKKADIIKVITEHLELN